ncbi:hypothetical protein CDAR_605931 [Caerostris darwini]|uniref:Uncharacterized protein n=1 Tax=Caerostris darwini TaxID=1538125 RepID=A0AAV4QJE5_9ARAC|nr:hypothetical protein CDAR_605931 [Caerostris darwini]
MGKLTEIHELIEEQYKELVTIKLSRDWEHVFMILKPNTLRRRDRRMIDDRESPIAQREKKEKRRRLSQSTSGIPVSKVFHAITPITEIETAEHYQDV